MRHERCVAMVLAGGNGARLGSLTTHAAKPMIPFGGKYKIIDFTLSNCANSGIGTVGVLTQHMSETLHDYIGDGRTWHLDGNGCGIHMLPSSRMGRPYTGTADAVYQNMLFIEKYDPEYVIVLAGDHIYKMDYGQMLAFHIGTGADVTLAALPVSWKEAPRFGVISAAENGQIACFEEKPRQPKSNLVSMGIYIFSWETLKRFLRADNVDRDSHKDFARNIIPVMLASGKKLYAYRFHDYWRDIGTVQSLWEANMDIAKGEAALVAWDQKWGIMTRKKLLPRSFIAKTAWVNRSIVADGCVISGGVDSSVLFDSVHVREGAEIIDSILMPGAFVGKNARIYKTIVGANVFIGDNVGIGTEYGTERFIDRALCMKGTSLVSPGVYVDAHTYIKAGSHINADMPPRLDRANATVTGRVVLELARG